jgi:hypothetical protein
LLWVLQDTEGQKDKDTLCLLASGT